MASKLQKIGRYVTDILPAIVPGRLSDRDMMVAIVRKTLSFGKLSETLSRTFFRSGFFGNNIVIWPPCNSDSSFFNGRSRLVKEKLLFCTMDTYVSNAYGILRIVHRLLPGSKEVAELLEHITKIFKKEKIPLQALANEEAILVNLDEVVVAGNKKFEDGKKRRNLTVDWLLVYFREVAEDHKLVVLEPESVAEKGKVRGCIRNWLKECKVKNLEPKEHLLKVVQYWQSFADGELVHHETARPITLNWEVASWQQYYTYRVEIDAWLKNPKEFTPIQNIEDWENEQFGDSEG